MKNWKTSLCGAAVAALTVAQEGFAFSDPTFWARIVTAVALVLAKDAGVTGGGM